MAHVDREYRIKWENLAFGNAERGGGEVARMHCQYASTYLIIRNADCSGICLPIALVHSH